MKKLGYVVLIVVLIALFLHYYLKVDYPVDNNKTDAAILQSEMLSTDYPTQENITLDGVDYLQSQAPVGNFGGTLVSSTIGEGPKTFNPFNSKDNISSTMSGILYDGLIGMHPITGQPVPKLAKDFKISGNDYIIYL